MDPGLVALRFAEGPIVGEVVFVVEDPDQVVDAFRGVLVEVVQLETNQEGVELQVAICLSEGHFQGYITIVSGSILF